MAERGPAGERGPQGDHGQGDPGPAGPVGPAGADSEVPGPPGPRGERSRLPERWYRDVWLLVISVIVYLAISGQADQGNKLEDSVSANCTVLGVLLTERADRDASVKLFSTVRARDPVLFDKLIARAEAGDKKLVAAAPALSCRVAKKTLRKLRLDRQRDG